MKTDLLLNEGLVSELRELARRGASLRQLVEMARSNLPYFGYVQSLFISYHFRRAFRLTRQEAHPLLGSTFCGNSAYREAEVEEGLERLLQERGFRERHATDL